MLGGILCWLLWGTCAPWGCFAADFSGSGHSTDTLRNSLQDGSTSWDLRWILRRSGGTKRGFAQGLQYHNRLPQQARTSTHTSYPFIPQAFLNHKALEGAPLCARPLEPLCAAAAEGQLGELKRFLGEGGGLPLTPYPTPHPKKGETRGNMKHLNP